MILWVLLFVGAALTFSIYIKNKQADRERNKRERLHEKQEQLIEQLRNKKEQPEQSEPENYNSH